MKSTLLSKKWIEGLALKVLPVFTVYVVIAEMRPITVPVLLATAVLLGLTGAFWFRPKNGFFLATGTGMVFFGLLTMFFLESTSLRWIINSITILGFALLFIFRSRPFIKDRRVYILAAQLALVFIFGFEIIDGFRKVREVTADTYGTEIKPSLELGVYPYGEFPPLSRYQGVRYPELIHGDINYWGARYSDCDFMVRYDNLKIASCLPVNEKPYDIFRPFLIPGEFVNIYTEHQEIGETVSKSFLQGLTKDRDGQVGRYLINPICAKTGYVYLEILGDRVNVRMAGDIGKTLTMPFLWRRRYFTEGESGIKISESSLKLVEATPTASYSEFTLFPPTVWKIAVIPFMIGWLILIPVVMLIPNRKFRKFDS